MGGNQLARDPNRLACSPRLCGLGPPLRSAHRQGPSAECFGIRLCEVATTKPDPVTDRRCAGQEFNLDEVTEIRGTVDGAAPEVGGFERTEILSKCRCLRSVEASFVDPAGWSLTGASWNTETAEPYEIRAFRIGRKRAVIRRRGVRDRR